MPEAYAQGSTGEHPDDARGATAGERVRAARTDRRRVLLEGVHAVKHAVRFGAEVEVVVTPDAAELSRLLGRLAPDVTLPTEVVELTATQWRAAAGRELPSPALAVARRPSTPADGSVAESLLAPGDRRVVVLEQPRHLGNLGAAVRVAAAADAAGLLVVGDADPWHPTAVRAAAGLQFALPVARAERLPPTSRPVVAVAPDDVSHGEDEGRVRPGLAPADVPAGAVLLFGTERAGLSPALAARAEATVGIPMRAGVSSLNLATAVAVLLYAG